MNGPAGEAGDIRCLLGGLWTSYEMKNEAIMSTNAASLTIHAALRAHDKSRARQRQHTVPSWPFLTLHLRFAYRSCPPTPERITYTGKYCLYSHLRCSVTSSAWGLLGLNVYL